MCPPDLLCNFLEMFWLVTGGLLHARSGLRNSILVVSSTVRFVTAPPQDHRNLGGSNAFFHRLIAVRFYGVLGVSYLALLAVLVQPGRGRRGLWLLSV